jgi:competence protein ComGC
LQYRCITGRKRVLEENADAANVRIIEGAVAVYIAEKGGQPTIEDLVSGGYLKEKPKSPYDATKGYDNHV